MSINIFKDILASSHLTSEDISKFNNYRTTHELTKTLLNCLCNNEDKLFFSESKKLTEIEENSMMLVENET